MKSLLLAAARPRPSAAAARSRRPLRYFMDARGFEHRGDADGPIVNRAGCDGQMPAFTPPPHHTSPPSVVSCDIRHDATLAFLSRSLIASGRVLRFKTS